MQYALLISDNTTCQCGRGKPAAAAHQWLCAGQEQHTEGLDASIVVPTKQEGSSQPEAQPYPAAIDPQPVPHCASMLSHLSFCCSCLRISCRLLRVCMPVRLQRKQAASGSRANLEQSCPVGPGWVLCGVLT